MRVAVKFAYDGIPFHGYARQPNLKTVEGELIITLKKNGYIQNANDAVLRSASRTDKGVSSLGNVLAFNTEKKIDDLIAMCNKSLESVVLYGKKITDEAFYPRHANQRIYKYYFIKQGINFQALKSTISLFVGTHNFTNFARVESHKNPMRTIDDIQVSENGSFYVLTFLAQTFLWNQIRRIVSAIMKVHQHKITKKDVKNALERPEKQVDFGLAPSFPLMLNDIIYPFSFESNKTAIKKKEELEKHLLDQIKYLFLKNANTLMPQKQ